MFSDLSSVSKTSLILLFVGIWVTFVVRFIVGIYFFKNRKAIIEKYDIGYLSSFIFGAFMLAPFTIGLPGLLFEPKEEGIFALILSAIYPVILVSIYLLVSRKKPHRIKRIFIMMIFTASFLGFLFGKLISSVWENAKNSNSRKSTEDLLKENIEKANQYYYRKEAEDFHKYQKGR